jgi:hypothetical protein
LQLKTLHIQALSLAQAVENMPVELKSRKAISVRDYAIAMLKLRTEVRKATAAQSSTITSWAEVRAALADPALICAAGSPELLACRLEISYIAELSECASRLQTAVSEANASTLSIIIAQANQLRMHSEQYPILGTARELLSGLTNLSAALSDGDDTKARTLVDQCTKLAAQDSAQAEAPAGLSSAQLRFTAFAKCQTRLRDALKTADLSLLHIAIHEAELLNLQEAQYVFFSSFFYVAYVV